MNARRRRTACALSVALSIAVASTSTSCSSGESGGAQPMTTASGRSTTTAEAPSTSPTTLASPSTVPGSPERLVVRVVETVAHDTDAFTEGLVFSDDGRLFESRGLEGESSVSELDPTTGKVLRSQALDADQFGEGLAIGPGGLVQLTWKSGVARTWNLTDLAPGIEMTYSGEGWGLTFNESEFIQSDGSATLTFRDADSFQAVGSVQVANGTTPVDQINELEWIEGNVLANVWHSDEIMQIDPDSGAVTAVIDASTLWNDPERTSEMTLNGIAHRPGDPANRVWLTGKNWPEIFIVDLVAA